MDERIEAFDDATAIRVLATIAKSHADAGDAQTELTRDLKEALASEFNTGPADEAVSDGDIARHALMLLAQAPEMQEKIIALAERPPQRMAVDPFTGFALGAAVLFALKSYIRIARNENGQWTFEFESKPLDKELLKSFVEKTQLYSHCPLVNAGQEGRVYTLDMDKGVVPGI